MLKPEFNEKIDIFVKACHKAARYGLVKCSSGNMSYRLGDELAAISASRVWLEQITNSQVAICEISNDACINEKIPSVESKFHLGILRQREDINVVLHFQTPYATALACGSRCEKVNFFVLPEIPFYMGKPAVVDFYPPGSRDLARNVIQAAKGTDMVVMKNHGMVTVAKDFDLAIQKAVFFEMACEVIIKNPKAKAIGQDVAEQIMRNTKI